MPVDREPPEEFGVAFLDWLRRVTEATWADLEETPEVGVNPSWRPGTTWTGGLGEYTVRDLEDRYRIRFPPDHRLFLRTLHSTTPWMRAGRYVDGRIERHDVPGFYDWLSDGVQLREAMANVARVMEELPFDSQGWQRTWLGQDPKPALIPVFGHRYVVADETQLILSIVDTDVIIYADNLRDYLLTELNLVR